MAVPYDALLLVSFGGPEKPDDVAGFLENVFRGQRVPRERFLEATRRYEPFGGESPLNAQNRTLLASLVEELNVHGPQLPVYWGNRNWHPLLAETIRQMADDGIHHALAFVTSAFGSYSGCRQYLEDIERARRPIGPDAPKPDAPMIDKLRLFYNHPGFIEPMADRVNAALEKIPRAARGAARIIFTAHSIPLAMARQCPYEEQLNEACRLVADRLGRTDWQLAYQSRSGPPSDPWLEPEVGECLVRLHEAGGTSDVVIVPIGFLAEHMEIVYDLDLEIRDLCQEIGLTMVRAATLGNHPRFVQMIRELILERIEENPTRLALGSHGPSPDRCPADCCLPGR